MSLANQINRAYSIDSDFTMSRYDPYYNTPNGTIPIYSGSSGAWSIATECRFINVKAVQGKIIQGNKITLHFINPNSGTADYKDFDLTWSQTAQRYDLVISWTNLSFINYSTFESDMVSFLTANPDGFSFTADVIEEPVLYTDYGFIRVYKTTAQNMQDLANRRFVKRTSSGSSSEYVYDDLTDFILGFYRYPFEISSLNRANIQLGYVDSGIAADLVDNQVYTLDFGSVAANGLYGNSSDIAQSEIEINLPFYGIVNLDSQFINTEISLVYCVDIISNSCVARIESNGETVKEIEFSLGFVIPYQLRTDYNKYAIGTSGVNSNILKNKRASLTIRQKPKADGESERTTLLSVVGECDGYCKFDNVEIAMSDASGDEKEMIKKLLESGVYCG